MSLFGTLLQRSREFKPATKERGGRRGVGASPFKELLTGAEDKRPGLTDVVNDLVPGLGDPIEETAMAEKPEQVSVSPGLEEMNSAFRASLAAVENGVKAGWDEAKGVWKPHASPEGGTKTIGYGHKLSPTDERQGSITWRGKTYSLRKGVPHDVVEEIFDHDVSKREAELEQTWPGWDDLDPRYQRVLVNISFNAGRPTPKTWPGLTKAMKANDDAGVRREMVTSYVSAKTKKRERLVDRANAIADALGITAEVPTS